MRAFWTWLEQLALDSLYPGAPFPRKLTALALVKLLLQARAEHPTACLPRWAPCLAHCFLLLPAITA